MYAGNATRPVDPVSAQPIGYRVETPEPNEQYVETPDLAYRREGQPVELELPTSTASAPAPTSKVPSIERTAPYYSENKQPAVLVLPHWWETQMDSKGRVYYKNNYKMTTSWNAPTAEQIALETQERSADARITTGGTAASAPSFDDAPPAYQEETPSYY